MESTTTAAEQLAKVIGCKRAITPALTAVQGKSGLESVLQDDNDCVEDKENRTFQKMVVRAMKK